MADKKITQLSSAPSVAATDVVPVVTDPSGTPTTQKTTLGELAATISATAVTGKVLTGYTSGAGTVASTDSVLQAIQKLNGNDALKANIITNRLNITFGQTIFWNEASSTAGSYGVQLGYAAGYNTNKDGTINIGYQAGRATSGSGSANDINIGYNAGYQSSDTSGDSVYIGANAASTSFKSGAGKNVGVGANALTALTSGEKNVAVGSGAGALITTGNGNIVAGEGADVSSPTASNELALGTFLKGNSATVRVSGSRQVVLETTKTPSSASDTGVTGTVCWDASYIYVCTATNTWKRVAIATW